MEAAARFANVHDLIQSIPDGYQARIGDTGVRLTGPQRLQVRLAPLFVTFRYMSLLIAAPAGAPGAACRYLPFPVFTYRYLSSRLVWRLSLLSVICRYLP